MAQVIRQEMKGCISEGFRGAVGIQDFTGSGGTFGAAGGEMKCVRLFGWRQRDFASSQMVLKQLWGCRVFPQEQSRGCPAPLLSL